MKFLFPLYFFLGLLITESRAQILRVDKSHLSSDSASYFTATLNLNFSLDSRSVAPSEKLAFTRLTSRADLLYVGENTAYIFVSSIE